jgi:nucleotide-binding universal stress UspA family protein
VIWLSADDPCPVTVGIDGSPEGTRAIGYGAWEARRRRVGLRLVHAYAPPGPAQLLGRFHDSGQLRRRAEGVVHTAARVADPDHELEVEERAVAGDPVRVLIQVAAESALLVVGSGRPRMSRLVTGAVSAQVAMHAPAPVVVTRPSWQLTDEKSWTAPGHGPVVVGIDGSAASDAALGFAIEEASFRRAPLEVYHVWDLPVRRRTRPGEPARTVRVEARQAAERLLAEALLPWLEKHPDVEVRPHAVHAGDPLQTLVDASTRSVLVVVGAGWHRGVHGLIAGRLGSGLIRHAHSPVAVVHTPVQAAALAPY